MNSALTGYIQVGSFQGECTDDEHANWTRIQRLWARTTRTVGGFQQSQVGLGGTSVGEVAVLKEVDAASVKIQYACATGQSIPTVTIELFTIVSGNSLTFLNFTLSSAIVIGYELDLDSESGRLIPCEKITFTYTQATWTYTKYNSMGVSQGTISESYSIGQTSS
jgi:type VI secretion system secreted protein Hcp